MKNKCHICENTGITKCLDFSLIMHLPSKKYNLNNLIQEYGIYDLCPDCKISDITNSKINYIAN